MTIQLTDQTRLRTICNHEAGHYIVARELSFKTDGLMILIESMGGHSGYAAIQPWTSEIYNIEDSIHYLKRRIQVLYAGAIAESTEKNRKYDSNHALHEWQLGGSIDDYAKIRELTQTLRNVMYPNTTNEDKVQKELTLINNELCEKTGAIITMRLKLVFGISSMIFKKVKLYNTEYKLKESEINNIQNIRKLYIDSKGS